MKELDCENIRCPLNEESSQISKDRICNAGLTIWSQCHRWKPYVEPDVEEKSGDKE